MSEGPDPYNTPMRDVCVTDVHGFLPRVRRGVPKQQCLAQGGLYRGVSNVYTMAEELVGFPLQAGCTDTRANNYDATAVIDDKSCQFH